MQKQKKRFSRQSTTDLQNPQLDYSKQKKIQRKNQIKPPLIPKPKQDNNKNFKKQQSTVTHLTKRSLFDRKNSQQSQQRPKSLALVYRGKYRQPGVFSLNDKQFLELYKNDPFARQKINYVLKMNQQKLKKNKILASSIHNNCMVRINDLSSIDKYSLNEIQQMIKNKTFVRCKSQSDLVQAQECLHYKQLIVTNSQSYSGCTV